MSLYCLNLKFSNNLHSSPLKIKSLSCKVWNILVYKENWLKNDTNGFIERDTLYFEHTSKNIANIPCNSFTFFYKGYFNLINMFFIILLFTTTIKITFCFFSITRNSRHFAPSFWAFRALRAHLLFKLWTCSFMFTF